MNSSDAGLAKSVKQTEPDIDRTKRGRIMVVTTALNRGGTELHLASVMPRLVREGFEITVSAVSGGGPVGELLRQGGIGVVAPAIGEDAGMVKRSYEGRPMAGFRALLGALRQNPVDIIQSFLPLGYLAGYAAARLSRTGALIMCRRIQNDYQSRYPGMARLESYLHKRTTYLLGNSKRVARQLIDEGAPVDRVGLLYNGVDIAPYLAEFDRAEHRNRLGIGNDTLVMTVVANVRPFKGHMDLLDGLGRIKSELPPDWVLQIVGRDDGLQSSLEQRARKLGIGGNVRFLGQSTNVAPHFRISDIGLLTSHDEGFSNAVLEGMAAGLPMVVTDVGGNAEAVLHGEQGLVVPPHEPREIGRAILKLARDPELRQAFGERAQKRAQENFSIDACVENYCRLYDAVLDGRNPGLGVDFGPQPINLQD